MSDEAIDTGEIQGWDYVVGKLPDGRYALLEVYLDGDGVVVDHALEDEAVLPGEDGLTGILEDLERRIEVVKAVIADPSTAAELEIGDDHEHDHGDEDDASDDASDA